MRTGLIAKKIGMSRFFKSDGTNIPVTLLKVDMCKVVDHKLVEKDGYNAIKVLFGASKKNKVNKPAVGYFKKIKSEASNFIREFRVSKDAMIEVGSHISVNHFIEGQFVDVSGFTIGKGFAGGMKRHNFSGNRATHGVSISHRSHGSTGQCQDPGKVFKGKKMAGRLGNVKRTMQNLKIIQTDSDNGLIVIKGSIPGPKGLFVSVCDSVKVKNKNLPYPTFDDVDSSKDTKIEINNPVEVPPENFNKQEAMPKDLAQPEIKKKESDVELKEKNETSS